MLGNCKIKVNDEAESKEAQELFEKLGYAGGAKNNSKWLFAKSDDMNVYNYVHDITDFQELTLPQLRDLVVLHRNDVEDANVVDPEFKTSKLYLCSNDDLYVFSGNTAKWKLSNHNGVSIVLNRLVKAKTNTQEQGLISGADALRALADGVKPCEIEGKFTTGLNSMFVIMDGKVEAFVKYLDAKVFRIKSLTIKIEIEIPAPFEPKVGEEAWCLDGSALNGYRKVIFDDFDLGVGFWRTEEEIKQVVAVLRQGFKL